MSEASSLEKRYFRGIEKMRFLYLSISADHASSLPSRHSFTRRVSGHAIRNSSWVPLFRGAIFRSHAHLADVELFNVPQRVRIENRRPEIPDAVFCAGQNIGTRQTNYR